MCGIRIAGSCVSKFYFYLFDRHGCAGHLSLSCYVSVTMATATDTLQTAQLDNSISSWMISEPTDVYLRSRVVQLDMDPKEPGVCARFAVNLCSAGGQNCTNTEASTGSWAY